jgi:two-component system, NarL family, response regulator DevR
MANVQKALRVLLVDDHEVTRVGLRTFLEKNPTIRVVGEAENAQAALTETIRLEPDVVVMDVRLPDATGIEACREIRARCPDTRVLFLTSYADEDAVMSTVLAGASGYLLKRIGSEELTKTILAVAQGQCILDPSVTRSVFTRLQTAAHDRTQDPAAMLSPQEVRILELVAGGKTNKEIAVALTLSEHTVRNHLVRIFKKCAVTRRSEAAAWYVKTARRPQG